MARKHSKDQACKAHIEEDNCIDALDDHVDNADCTNAKCLELLTNTLNLHQKSSNQSGRTWIAESTAATAQNIIRIPQKSKIGGHSQQATIQPRLPKKGFQISVACSTHSMWTMKTPSGHHQVMASAVWLAQETHLYQHLLAMIPNPWRHCQSFEAYGPRSKSSHPSSQHQTNPDEQRCSPQPNEQL